LGFSFILIDPCGGDSFENCKLYQAHFCPLTLKSYPQVIHRLSTGYPQGKNALFEHLFDVEIKFCQVGSSLTIILYIFN
jgi:hypothetical protein